MSVLRRRSDALVDSDKIPVIYILSNHRSGSTLLDLILGAHPKIWTLGEAQDLPWVLKEKQVPCGCGQQVEQCEFWKELIPDILVHKGRYPIGYFRDEYFSENKLRSRELRLALFKGLLLETLTGKTLKEDTSAIEEYAELNVQYFRIVWEAAKKQRGEEIRWLVDASKDPNRLYWLQRSQKFDLRVIRLVRDVRGFANSVTRPKHNRKMVLLASRRWLVNNIIFILLCRSQFKKDQVFSLHYKDLANRAASVLEDIGRWLDLEFPKDAHEHFREYQNHAISGNNMRWQEKGIHLDEMWKNELPWLDVLLVGGLTWPFRKLLGF
jgi:hypothetical protein